MVAMYGLDEMLKGQAYSFEIVNIWRLAFHMPLGLVLNGQ